MQVTYVFNLDNVEENNDQYELKKFQSSDKMFLALSDLEELRRSVMKGWINPTVEEFEQKIAEILYDSGYYEIE